MERLHELLSTKRMRLQDKVSQIVKSRRHGDTIESFHAPLTECSVLLIELRQLNREILQNEEDVKMKTEAEKLPLDRTTLQLNNLLYEKSHYVRAIKGCNDFRTKHPNIKIIPKDDFLKEHSAAEWLNDPHRLTLERLSYELKQRKSMDEQKRALLAAKEAMQSRVNVQKQFLQALQEKIWVLNEASQSIAQHLGLQSKKDAKRQRVDGLLPPALYVLYSQLQFYREALSENVDVEIMGSLETTKFSQSTENEIRGESDDRGTKLNDQGQALKEIGESSMVHALSVVLTIPTAVTSSETNCNKGRIVFNYLQSINIISAWSDNIPLHELFPGDDGTLSPNPSAAYTPHSLEAFEGKQGKPYKWAQELAGLDFLSEIPRSLLEADNTKVEQAFQSGLEMYRSQNRIRNLIDQVRLRLHRTAEDDVEMKFVS